MVPSSETTVLGLIREVVVGVESLMEVSLLGVSDVVESSHGKPYNAVHVMIHGDCRKVSWSIGQKNPVLVIVPEFLL